jgi:hypothetical protein
MESESESELQDWQKEILKMELNPLYLKPQQQEMIEKLLYPSDSNPFWVEEKYKLILGRVLNLGFYEEGDREALNWARECYLKGKNWVK